jgi:hypothetical protein
MTDPQRSERVGDRDVPHASHRWGGTSVPGTGDIATCADCGVDADDDEAMEPCTALSETPAERGRDMAIERQVGDRVQIVGAHPWSGYAGVVTHVSALDGGITVRLDCGLRATVADPRYYRIAHR